MRVPLGEAKPIGLGGKIVVRKRNGIWKVDIRHAPTPEYPDNGMQAEDVGGYNTDRLNQFSVVQQGSLVLNVVVDYPGLDLAS